jgi:hypothetical protein
MLIAATRMIFPTGASMLIAGCRRMDRTQPASSHLHDDQH